MPASANSTHSVRIDPRLLLNESLWKQCLWDCQRLDFDFTPLWIPSNIKQSWGFIPARLWVVSELGNLHLFFPLNFAISCTFYSKDKKQFKKFTFSSFVWNALLQQCLHLVRWCSNIKSCFPGKLFLRIQFERGQSLLIFLLYLAIWTV